MDALVEQALDDHAEFCCLCGKKQFLPTGNPEDLFPLCGPCIAKVRKNIVEIGSDGTAIPEINLYETTA